MSTSTVIAAVNQGFSDAGDSIFDLLTANMSTILTVAGILLAIGVAWRLFRRVAR